MKHILVAIFSLCFGLQLHAQEHNQLNELIQKSRYTEAIRMIEDMEPSRELSLKKVYCYKALTQYRAARNELLTLSAEYPDDSVIKSELAICYEAIDEPKASLECYEQLIASDSANQFFKLKKGDLLYKMENYDSALVVFKELFEQDSLVSAVKRLAQCHDKIHEYESAAHYYNVAYDMDTTDMNALGNLINTHLKIQNYRKVIYISESYISKDSTNNIINLMNALGYYGIDEYEKAVPRFERCYRNNDTSLIVNRSLGISLYSLDRNIEAIKYLEDAFRQDSTNNNVLYCMAVAYGDLKKNRESLNCYHKLLERITPKNLEMFLYNRNAANQYYELGEYESAIRYYERAIPYGNKEQKLNQYYAIGSLYRDEINDQQKAIYYFDIYIKDLQEWLAQMEQKPNKDEYDQREIYEMKLSLKTVREYINRTKPKE